MPHTKYQDFRFTAKTLELINDVQQIIEEYQSAGYSLTLRQVYYQLVARGLIENTDRSYRIVGNAVNDGRLAGMIDWHAIEDRTRYIRTNSHWNTPADIIKSAAYSYYLDHWKDMENYVEVWVEKDALVGIVQDVCKKWDVPCFSCRGYTSQSEMWAASQRFIDKQDEGKDNFLIHLGDHDPSGIDMTRDINDRLQYFGANVGVNRIALNRDQINTYKPPPNPAKITDSRAADYIKKHGKTSWELDALRPEVLTDLIEDEIMGYMDRGEFERVKTQILEGKLQLNKLCDNWNKVSKLAFMKDLTS